MTFTVAQESPDQPEIHALITALDEALDSQYQGFCNYRLDVSALLAPQVRFFVARDAAKKAIGIGAVRFSDGENAHSSESYAEVKRMYTSPEVRGQGVGEAILLQILATIKQTGEKIVRLETGEKLTAAVALYRKHRFVAIPAFGEYVATADTSYCMELRL